MMTKDHYLHEARHPDDSYKYENKSVIRNGKFFLLTGNPKQEASVSYKPRTSSSGDGEYGSPDSDGEGDSFIVIKAAGPKDFFNLRVTLQAFEGGE